MTREKSLDLEEACRDSTEYLLAEGEGHMWKIDDETDSCNAFATGLLQFFTLSVFFLLGILFGFLWHGDLDSQCSRYVSQYSPVMSDVDITYNLQQFNNSLLGENVYRLDASPETDAAWDALGVNYRGIRVSPGEAELSGLGPDHVQISEKYGGGFVAQLEGFHHLTCLNILRQSLYYNYDYYHAKGEGVFANNDYILRRHVSQCLETLRQQLMCTVDTGVLGQVWVYPDNPEPFTDFQTRHICKNFEDVRHWAEINQLPQEQPRDFLEPPAPGVHVYERMP